MSSMKTGQSLIFLLPERRFHGEALPGGSSRHYVTRTLHEQLPHRNLPPWHHVTAIERVVFCQHGDVGQ